jgi:hypothetical protein
MQKILGRSTHAEMVPSLRYWDVEQMNFTYNLYMSYCGEGGLDDLITMQVANGRCVQDHI